jgi:hypothetical protein
VSKNAGILVTPTTLGLKASETGLVEGRLVRFSDKENPDQSRMKDFFTDETDFDFEFPGKCAVYFHHGLSKSIGAKKLTTAELTLDNEGVFAKAQLDLSDPDQVKIFDGIKNGEIGWSSGVPATLVVRERQSNGTHKITQWPLGKDASLTPVPADPNNVAYAVKSLVFDDTMEEQFSALETSFTLFAERAAGIKALRGADGFLNSPAWQWRMCRLKDLIDQIMAEVEPVPGADEIQGALLSIMGASNVLAETEI